MDGGSADSVSGRTRDLHRIGVLMARLSDLPKYRWDDKAAQFRGADGRFIKRRVVRDVVDDFIDTTAKQLRGFSQQLVDGDISLSEWESIMRRGIKDTHLYTSALGKGGWEQMSPSDYGLVGLRVREQYEFLRGFLQDVSSGKQVLNHFFLLRTEMYAQAARRGFYEVTRAELEKRAYTLERNVLSPADHCQDCIDEADKGWVKIGTIRKIGDRQCKAQCRCYIEYRKN